MYYLQRRIHPTWHMTAMCVGIVLGVVAALKVAVPHAIVVSIVGLLCVVVALAGKWRWLLFVAVIGGMLVGVARGSAVQETQSFYTAVYGRSLVVTGTIADDVEKNSRGENVFRLRDIKIGGMSRGGSVWVTSRDDRSLRRSDEVTFSGKLTPGFGAYAASMYSATLTDVQRIKNGDIALDARNILADGVRKNIDEPAASLGIGYLLGQKSVLPRGLNEALVVTGLTHIVVASGYNLTILVRLARRAFEKVSKYLSVLTSSALIIGFIAVTGLSPSMTRAGLVAGLGLWAWYYGRKFHPVTLLALAMSVTLIYNPAYAWGDVGWALSFAAFAGVMIVAPVLAKYFWGTVEPSFVGRLMIETLSAILMTMPITLVVFGKLSVIAVAANMLIVPLVPLAMLLTFVAGVIGVVLGSSIAIIGVPAQFLLSTMIMLIEKCANIPWAQLPVSLTLTGCLLWYAVMAIAVWYMAKKSDIRLRETSLVE